MKTIEHTIIGNHPLEQAFDIVPNSTERTIIRPDIEVQDDQPVAEAPVYDDRDSELDRDLNVIYTQALSAAQIMEDDVDQMEPKYRARTHETAAQMMMVALNAAQQRLQLKMHKDKVSAKPSPNTVNNNLIVADRNQIMRMLAADQNTEPDDAQ